ncbi:hypothetical protein OCU04_006784 [Sclerotinia nivalis]|uniref:Cytochrome P450 alkane hydroxylase n=1 Tax=Sclerotinia nivalis TaxID=352851 RepID=A0A9X0AKI3_9HELO|nr:hypothetical protein OCU04_006784 [Sclerotinia nivalis]
MELSLYTGSGQQLVGRCIIVTVVIAFGLLLPKWKRSRNIRNLKRRHNCAETNKYPHQDVLGTDLARIRAQAVQEGHLFRLYKSQFDTYGKTFSEVWRGTTLFNTTEPANIQHVAALAAEDFGKDPDREIAQWPLLGPSIFSDGPAWSLSRELVKPIFARAELSDLDFFASCVDKFLELLPEKGETFDIQPLLHRLFLDSSMDFIFGRSLNALQAEASPESVEFTEAFTTGLKEVSARRDAPWFQFHYQRFIEGPTWKKAYKTVHRFVDRQVQLALLDTAKEEANDVQSERKRYVLLHEMAKQIRDPIALRYHVLGFFAPARDVTSRLVANALFQLARHPNEWTKLRRISLELGDAPLSFGKLKQLAEFRYVLQETIRTVGPAARIWRAAVRDTILPRGGGDDQTQPVFIPRGSPVVLGTWCMNHDSDIWGDDVEMFRPDRFIGRKMNWEFLPFYGGPRICPAQQQAMTQAAYVLVRLTQMFEIIENRDPEPEFLQLIKMGVESMNGAKIAFR